VARVVETLEAGGCEPVLVVVAGEGAAPIAREAEAAGAWVLVNPDPGEGPITSLRVALEAVEEATDAVAFCPVDHPLIRPGTVRTLLDAFGRDRPALLLPVLGGRHGHPTLFARSLWDELRDPQLTGGARTVVHAHLEEALVISVDDPGVLTDIDTPEQYVHALGGGPA